MMEPHAIYSGITDGAYNAFSILNLIIILSSFAIILGIINYIIITKQTKNNKNKTKDVIISVFIFNLILKILELIDDSGPTLDYWHKSEIDIILKYTIKLIPFIIQTIIFIKISIITMKRKKKEGKN